MQRRIIRLTTEDSSSHLYLEEAVGTEKCLRITASCPDDNTKIHFNYDNNMIKELLNAIETLRPAK